MKNSKFKYREKCDKLARIEDDTLSRFKHRKIQKLDLCSFKLTREEQNRYEPYKATSKLQI